MKRPPESERGDPIARHAEMDRSVYWSGLILTLVTALVSLAFWSRSPVLTIAGWTPVAFRGVRFFFVRTELGLYRWAVGNGLISGIAIIAASSVAGGITSPVLMFSVVVGVMTSMMFAHQRLWDLFPFAIVGGVGIIDRLDGGFADIDWLVPVSVTVVALAIPRLVSDMVAVEFSYREKAVLDPLTGCLNRTSLSMRIHELELQAKQTMEHVGVIAIDIDNFKSVNDRFGHAVGDEVLEQVAFAIRRNLRRFELLYRTGGEEFILLLPGASLAICFHLGESIRQAVANEEFSVGRVTISVGVAAQQAPEDLAQLIEQADRSLLQAKSEGRNRTVQAAG